ncbi:pre-rrna processing protein [Lasallia pustulata]|uniref:Multiple RNA-binding domain-containing protein 1 n=1 Tax=Lasallia pustulata TaxID=136370 RepID=A0A1W5CVY8_9LECA|nr:pre-rrna processing protein [Lasallia pustulata]
MTAEDFKTYFSKQSTITDAKFIPHRRIGYIGYKTHNDAAKAVKYYNKSFIRMSRIVVELARSVEDQDALKVRDTRFTGSSGIHVPKPTVDAAASERPLKRRLDVQETAVPETDPKLQEFLEVMQPPSKSKTWANGDAVRDDVGRLSSLPTIIPSGEEGKSDNEYEPVPKKRKKTAEPKKAEAAPAPIKSNVVLEPQIVVEESSVLSQQVGTATSDADWLRSRTSRLLGLVDDEGSVTFAATSNEDNRQKTDKSWVSMQKEESPISDASVQMDGEPPIEAPAATNVSTLETLEESSATGRLFVRNLPYSVAEDELRAHFVPYGDLEEVHLSVDSRTGAGKGFAYVQYSNAQSAPTALRELDGKPFQGRLMHILPGTAKKGTSLDEFAVSKLPIKKQKQIKRKAEAASSTFNWNSMYMNADAVMSSISGRLGISKSELLDPSSSDAAVRQAHAETHIIQETKAYFNSNGVNLDAFKKGQRGDTAILVKNFPYGTKSEELKRLFEAHGTVTKLLMPPSGTIAIIEFEQASQARSAFGTLAYRKFKDSVLFLEKAPKDLFSMNITQPSDIASNSSNPLGKKTSASELLQEDSSQQGIDTSTLFVRNLNFSTTNDGLRQAFQPLDGFLSARVKTKPDPKKPGQLLSMGFGFLEFRSKEQAHAALAAMDGYKLDGHELLIKASHKALDAAHERRKEDRAKRIAGRKTKIIVKNLPFEASKKDVRSLFGAYGQLRSVRLPKKFDSSTRGFAFADFVTAREAENAMDALRDTHFLGRRLVLDFAAGDAIDPEEELDKMQKKMGRQADKVALQKLTGTGRRKFNVGGEGGDDVPD